MIHIESSRRPCVGISPGSDRDAQEILKDRGYILEVSEREDAYDIHLGKLDSTDSRSLREHIDRLNAFAGPLLHFGVWPNGLRSALAVTGIDVDQEERVSALGKKVDAANYSVGLYHYPDFVPQLEDLPYDLLLCGHSHGGQVRLPLRERRGIVLRLQPGDDLPLFDHIAFVYAQVFEPSGDLGGNGGFRTGDDVAVRRHPRGHARTAADQLRQSNLHGVAAETTKSKKDHYDNDGRGRRDVGAPPQRATHARRWAVAVDA